MIHIDRSRVSPPHVLTGENHRGNQELERASRSLDQWRANGGDPGKWSFEFDAYRDPQVKRKLAELFYGKCAYCESSYGATQPMDVEHWRPKGQIENADGSKGKPAYYWLAATWDNLFPSCIDCNRKREQLDALTNDRRLIGKADQFPLADGSTRAVVPGQEDREVPLLLNPCVDAPEDYLSFTTKAVVRPRAAESFPQERARVSIDVYALNRSDLVLARKEVLRLIQLHVARISRIAQFLEMPGLPDYVGLFLDELLFNELRELARMRRSDQPYALMARQLIDQWMQDLAVFGISEVTFSTPEVPGRAE